MANQNQEKSDLNKSSDAFNRDTRDNMSSPTSSIMSSEDRGTLNRDNIREIAGDVTGRARHLADEVSSRARDYYGTANNWMHQNQRSVWMALGLFAVAGVVGYFISRNNRYSEDFDLDRDLDFDRNLSGNRGINRDLSMDRSRDSIR